MNYSNMTDAELRATLIAGNCHIGLAEGEAVKRFCDTTELDKLRKTLAQAEGLMVLIESQVTAVNACLEEIKDALQRATE